MSFKIPDRYKETSPGVFEQTQPMELAEATISRTSPNASVRETGRGGLHEQIMAHCDAQWPRWKYRHSRTDKKTHEEEGVEDFTIFLPSGRTVHIECKSRDGKLTARQRDWAKELSMLGHEVFLVRSLEEFLEVVK
jgi:hypothetical protein